MEADKARGACELVGLRRSRVDLRNRKVRVTERLVRLDSGEWLRKEPKTGASVRSISISALTAEILAGHLERFAVPGLDGASPRYLRIWVR